MKPSRFKFIRTSPERTATGSTSLVELENLNGFFLGGKMSRKETHPLQILIEVGGGRHPTLKDLEQIQERMHKADALPREVFLWVKPDTLLTNRGFVPLATVLRQNIEKLEKETKDKRDRNGAS